MSLRQSNVLKINLFFIVSLQIFSSVYAQTHHENVALFVEEISTPSYDCPSDEPMEQVEQFLASSNISSKNRNRLFLHKTHWMICQGSMLKASEMVKEWMNTTEIDRGSYVYAMANYQIGFVYDMHEDEKRCEYYREALDASKFRKDDVYLSASLVMLTMCSGKELSVSRQLGALYSLLETYSVEGNNAELAHIRNNIGLLYGSIRQTELAAEQYEKAYELGLAVYDKKNRLPTLVSAINAYWRSGNYEKMDTLLNLLKDEIRDVATPLIQVHYYLQLVRFYNSTGRYELVPDKLKKLSYFLELAPNPNITEYAEFQRVKYCLHINDLACLTNFVQQRKNSALTSQPMRSNQYIGIMVHAALAVRDLSTASHFFELYVEGYNKHLRQSTQSGKVLGVANMHAQIIDLESSLVEQKENQWREGLLIALFSVSVMGAAFYAQSYYKRQKFSVDQLTGCLSKKALYRSLKRIRSPEDGKVHALGLWDIEQSIENSMNEDNKNTLIAMVASVIRQSVRNMDIVSRISPYQFVICLQNIDDNVTLNLFERTTEKLQQSLITDEDRSQTKSINTSVYSTAERINNPHDAIEELRISLSMNTRREQSVNPAD
jgi:GGDEF domain-containing protein